MYVQVGTLYRQGRPRRDTRGRRREVSDCKNRIGERCLLNGELCPHLVYDGKCEHANCDELEAVTFKTALEIKLANVNDKRRRKDIRGAVRLVLAKTGLELDDAVTRFDYRTAAKFVEDTKSCYAPVTIATYVNIIYSFGDRKLRAEYERRELRMPLFDKVKVEVPKKVIEEMTWDQVRAVEDHMRELRKLALESNETARDEFVYFWCGYWFGIRPSDICRLKWASIQPINGIPHICFSAHKTKTEIVEPIPTEAYNEILPFVGVGGDYFISRHAEKRNRNWSDTFGDALHTSLQRRVNAFMRKIGITGWAAFYILRSRMAQLTYRAHGAEAESAKLGHTPSVARAHYYNVGDRRITI